MCCVVFYYGVLCCAVLIAGQLPCASVHGIAMTFAAIFRRRKEVYVYRGSDED